MIANFKRSLRGTLVDRVYYWLHVGRHERHTGAASSEVDLEAWQALGRPVPPPATIKHQAVLAFAHKTGLGTLIETGTFKGDMVYATKDVFKRIYSIELSSRLYKAARKRFADFPHIRIVNGDSAKVLRTILAEVHNPCIFWLDGHYSGGNTAMAKNVTPILDELGTIFSHDVKDHVVLIDDARLFTGDMDYPSLAKVQQFVETSRPGWKFEIIDDIIRVYGQ